MSYRLEPDESVDVGAKRVFDEVTNEAIGHLSGPTSDDLEHAVHETRKLCKKGRGLVRLVRPTIGESYTRTNRLLRDAARRLSDTRDAHALAEAAAELGVDAALQGELDRRAAGATHRLLTDDAHLLDEARDLIAAARVEPRHWDLPDEFETVAGGLAKTYKRGRNRLADAADDGSPEDFHEWRKRVKYGWYHIRLLQELVPPLLDPLADAYHELSNLLGDAHDLAVLEGIARRHDRHADVAVRLVERRRDLEAEAVHLGRAIYTEEPEEFTRRVAGYWEAATER